MTFIFKYNHKYLLNVSGFHLLLFFLLIANVFQAIVLPKLNACDFLFTVCVRGLSFGALVHTATRVFFVECKSDFLILNFLKFSVSPYCLQLKLGVWRMTPFFTHLVLVSPVPSCVVICSLFLILFPPATASLIFPSLCLLKSDIFARYSGRVLYLPFQSTFTVLPDYLIFVPSMIVMLSVLFFLCIQEAWNLGQSSHRLMLTE